MIKPVIIVCAFNEQKNIEGLLEAMSAQTYGEFNLFLIDDGSTDATLSIAQNYIKSHNLRHFKVQDKRHFGKEMCLREAILSVEDEHTLILTTDADCLPCSTWVESMVSKYEATNADMLIGPVAIDDSHPLQATEFLSIEAVTLGSAALGHPLMCGGANLGFTKAAYIKARECMPGSFSNGGDMYLLEAMKKLKMRIAPVVSNSATVVTKGADTVKEFFSQRSRWAGKAPKYTDPEIISAGVITALLQVIIIAAAVWAFFDIRALYVWLIKLVFDFTVLAITAVKQNRASLIPYIPPVSIIYPFYVITTLTLSLIRR